MSNIVCRKYHTVCRFRGTCVRCCKSRFIANQNSAIWEPLGYDSLQICEGVNRFLENRENEGHCQIRLAQAQKHGILLDHGIVLNNRSILV
jgi:hypothetical protein